MKELFEEHQIYNKLKQINNQATFPASDNIWREIEKFDRLMAHLMIREEKGFWKLYKGDYDFSPEVKEYLYKCHTYRGLLRIVRGRQWKWGNII